MAGTWLSRRVGGDSYGVSGSLSHGTGQLQAWRQPGPGSCCRMGSTVASGFGPGGMRRKIVPARRLMRAGRGCLLNCVLRFLFEMRNCYDDYRRTRPAGGFVWVGLGRSLSLLGRWSTRWLTLVCLMI